MPCYLTEQNLGVFLKEIAPELQFIHDKAVPGACNKRRRPDYRCDSQKLIIEFDGDAHYCKAQRVIIDKEKDLDYMGLGYTIFRIPYFIQLTEEMIGGIFRKNITFTQRYPHGFIDSKAVLPADFCELGIKRFLDDLERFSEYRNDVINSLRSKIKEKENIDLVIPFSLRHLVC
ncbi:MULTISPECIES: DUF559 domain-containing protein [Pectobacterium]|uniref:DUF559 domain-containing protein n=1 Tax=Pectobacterium TaxID=122277 RepID=UPI000D19C297|nr:MULTISPECIES: DUF559 domain-containing protein [Pectobacterium]AVT59756.1 hypothetical protein OA04_32330 [Pectobacterium versatile]RRO04161.1 DUF559 domain-containing protein [Pectobacterium aquaticum]